MGNAVGSEEGYDDENLPEAAPEVDGVVGAGVAPPRYSSGTVEASVAGAGAGDGGSPPRILDSPRTFVPQAPVPPMRRPADVPLAYNQMLNEQDDLDWPLEEEVPVLFVWTLGGKSVAVEGSWDNWKTQKPLRKSGKDYALLLDLPSGVYRYRFVVDGVRRHLPDLSFEEDVDGQIMNILDVKDFVPENTESVSEFVPPPSPDSSYSSEIPELKDFGKDPPAMPPQLFQGVLGTESSGSTSQKPQHIVLNHLYIEKGWSGLPLVALGFTHRFQAKYVTVVLYKPIVRPHSH